MRRALTPLLMTLLLVTGALPAAFAQQCTATPPPPPRDLAEFEGHYAYRDGGTLFIAARGEQLVAIIGDAKYVLRAAGADTFTNGGGEPIPFVRDPLGRVVAFRERGETFRRLAAEVPRNARLLLEPRPRDPQGRPVAYRYRRPAQLDDGLDTAAAGAGSLPTAVAERLVNGVVNGTYADVRSLLVHHRGALRLEEYFYGYDASRPHQMRSLTKSVIALLAGAAVDRGLLRGDEPALARLGYASTAHPDPRKAKVTLTDLLSHQSGMACDDRDQDSPGNEVALYEADDWVKAFVDLPMVADPGTVGRYCSGGILAAGRVVERAVGKPLPAFAQEVLFGPLGIEASDWRWDFTLDRSRRNEFGQIHLRPRDMLKLGLLLQQRGEWHGRGVLSAAWIDATVARRSRVDDSDYGLGLWHRWYRVPTAAGERRVDTLMLSGNGGQKVFLVPALDLVVVFTGGTFNAESPVNEMMAGVLLPAIIDASADPTGLP